MHAGFGFGVVHVNPLLWPHWVGILLASLERLWRMPGLMKRYGTRSWDGPASTSTTKETRWDNGLLNSSTPTAGGRSGACLW